jgi:hypothetical protein
MAHVTLRKEDTPCRVDSSRRGSGCMQPWQPQSVETSLIQDFFAAISLFGLQLIT